MSKIVTIASKGKRLLALRRAIAAKFDEENWRDIALLTDSGEMISNHPRLLRSLSFGDDDYAACVSEILPAIIDKDPGNAQKLEDLVDLPRWLLENDRSLYHEIYVIAEQDNTEGEEDQTQPPAADNVLNLLETIKSQLLNLASKGPISEKDYGRTRKLILLHPHLRSAAPLYIKNCRTLVEVWDYLGSTQPDDAARRVHIAETMNPLLDSLEHEESALLINNLQRGERIGIGGFGQGYRYKHQYFDQDFAVKIFDPAFSQGGEGHLERFFQEAKILLRLHHPNIIRIFDVGMLGSRPFIRMEYFPGKDLNEVLKVSGHIPAKKAGQIIKEVAGALGHAHKHVVHRDLKPSNIMIAPVGQVRVIDFGLGAFVEKELISRITRTGERAVSGLYTAPELTADPKLTDPRTDIYSLGAVWYTMLTGRPPAGADIARQLFEVNGVSQAYGKIVLRCLARVDTRHATCGELVDEIVSIGII